MVSQVLSGLRGIVVLGMGVGEYDLRQPRVSVCLCA